MLLLVEKTSSVQMDKFVLVLDEGGKLFLDNSKIRSVGAVIGDTSLSLHHSGGPKDHLGNPFLLIYCLLRRDAQYYNHLNSMAPRKY